MTDDTIGKAVKNRQVPFEYFAAANLILKMARETYAEGVKPGEDKRVKQIRKAIAAVIPSGGIEKVPHEVVKNEYYAIYAAIRFFRDLKGPKSKSEKLLEDGCAKLRLQGPGGRLVTICRPCPVPRARFSEFLKAFNDDQVVTSTLAEKVTAWRFGISPYTVHQLPGYRTFKKNSLSPTKRYRVRRPDSLDLFLSSVFFDLSSFPSSSQRQRLKAKILEALFLENYSPFLGYYLTQAANSVTRNATLRLCDEEVILNACKALHSTNDEERIDFKWNLDLSKVNAEDSQDISTHLSD